MRRPYAILGVYNGSVAAEGINEGKLYGNLPKSKEKREAEQRRRSRVNGIIDKNLGWKTVRFAFSSFVSNLDEARELSDFVLSEIPNSELVRNLGSSDHGRLTFNYELLIPRYTMKTRAKLVDVLLKSSYQPTIPRRIYVGAEFMKMEVDNVKEWKKLWRKGLKFVK